MNRVVSDYPDQDIHVSLGLFGGAGVDFKSMGYQAGMMVTRILRGEPAGSIPIEDAERYALVFHLDRAQALGVRIPDEILLAADEVYKRWVRDAPIP